MNSEELQSYYISLYLDSIFFCDDSIARIKDNIDAITSEEALCGIYNLLLEIEIELCYPKEIVKSIGDVIEYIKPYINKENEEIYMVIKDKYNQVKELDLNDGKYLYEAILKNFDVDNVFNRKFNKEVIRNSIIFDYYTFTTLLDDNIEVDENYFYIMSLKKLLLVYPQIFLDAGINKRALDILEVNKRYEETERLVYKMNNIEKFQENNFNFSAFTSIIDYVVVVSMLFNRKNIEKNTSLLTPSSISTIFELTDKKCIDDSNMKKNMYEIMSKYREKYVDIPSVSKEYRKKFIKRYNDSLGNLNGLTEYNHDTVLAEYISRSDIINKITNMFKPLDLNQLFEQDIEYFNYLINSSEIENKDNIYLTINKCLYLVPSMFDNEKIYNKTMLLLEKNNIHNSIVKKKINKIYRG